MTLTPDWPTCVHDEGCLGIQWGAGELCLAHADELELDDALSSMHPGADVDLRGTPISPKLLRRLRAALTPEVEDRRPSFGAARFDGAQFLGIADFGGARFKAASFIEAHFGSDVLFYGAEFADETRFVGTQFVRAARFTRAQFSEDALFPGATFGNEAGFGNVVFSKKSHFHGARFIGSANFLDAQFGAPADFSSVEFGTAEVGSDATFSGAKFKQGVRFDVSLFHGAARFQSAQIKGGLAFGHVQVTGEATFGGAVFSDGAGFSDTKFGRDVSFHGARFGGHASFMGVAIGGNARFSEAHFEGTWSSQLVCAGIVSAAQVELKRATRLQVAAQALDLRAAKVAAPCVLAVRYARINVSDMETSAPVTIASQGTAFVAAYSGRLLNEDNLSGDPRAKVVSVAGADAANLVLTDVDLSGCTFSGAHHLDQIRLEGRCLFAAAPSKHRGETPLRLRRWTRRKVLAEEAAWRANPAQHSTRARAGWVTPDFRGAPTNPASPAQLAVLYRQLRKALEDGKDAPGAADFYYGEMEARRHDEESTPRGERWLLWAYWALSGYALRASRALSFLAATAGVTFVLLMALGLPDNQLNPQITGTVPAPGGQAALAESTPSPVLTLPFGQRFTAARADQAALVVVNSVIFRSTDTTLTGPGTWIEIVTRIGEPVLLGFAAVAARGRVQR